MDTGFSYENFSDHAPLWLKPRPFSLSLWRSLLTTLCTIHMICFRLKILLWHVWVSQTNSLLIFLAREEEGWVVLVYYQCILRLDPEQGGESMEPQDPPLPPGCTSGLSMMSPGLRFGGHLPPLHHLCNSIGSQEVHYDVRVGHNQLAHVHSVWCKDFY